VRLKQVTIAGYRSIRMPTTIHLDPNVTVILGPNDHGKTNCLSALLHLNEGTPFAEDGDLNWDSEHEKDTLPSVLARFSLSAAEIQQIKELENTSVDNHNSKIAGKLQGEADEDLEDEDTEDVASEDGNTKGPLEEDMLDPVTDDDLAKDIVVKRVGLKGKLEVEASVELFGGTHKVLRELVPRFELINPVEKLSDSVTAEELSGKNEFMRGIFYYAGLSPNDSASLFEQNDRTERRLNQASSKLDQTLRETWSQGRNLRFCLRHDSGRKRINLLIEDPAVESRFVRASRRSSGFTHYFALKTILHARQRDHEANSYFLLFDEPGIYLHPSGQYDLLQVLETLSHESQIAYVTHSLFMINKTFPARHRLLMKDEKGTTLDGKPYVGRWQSVLGALGMTLTGTILFSNFVVLTEGDSDPIYLYAIFQKGVAAGKCHIDLNAVSFISTVESKHADVLIRLLFETVPKPGIGVLTDGDQGGKERLIYLNALITEAGIVARSLTKDTSLEDHLPNLREVFVPAVADYASKLMVLRGENKPDDDEFRQKFLADFDKTYDKGKVTTKVMDWVAKATAEIAGMKSKPSKVGIAREYALRLHEFPHAQLKWGDRQKALVDWLLKDVKVPELGQAPQAILRDSKPAD
jgi:predicted ATP-dependent endonuclease of OLD family